MKTIFSIIAPLALAIAVTGCSKTESQKPFVSDVATTEIGTAPAAAHVLGERKALSSMSVSTHSAHPMVAAKIRLEKASLLNRVFLYGADLQFSSIHEEGFQLYAQSMAVGHVPAFFQIVGDRLQLLADQRMLFESDNNHPARLLNQFPIVEQDATSITITVAHASPVLNTVVASGKNAPGVRTSWIRSAQFVAEGQFLMMETSLEMIDGSVAEFMETVFPRESLIAADAKPMFAVAAHEPSAERFRYLDMGMDQWLEVPGKGRVKTRVAQRFGIKPGEVITWYVTPNIPDEYLPQIKTGIEGWNRYSQAMYGKDMVRFAGKMPEGMKIGDPRYNIVNWDSVAEAGAAYESQASDPFTGIQTHSLIYLPKAWINIGKKYWENGAPSESEKAQVAAFINRMSAGSFLDQKLPIHCMREAFEAITLDAKQSPEDFAKELLKGVLLHEVGHALGLAHNFKGSLSWDPKDAKSMFTTSIMDYNQFHIERAAYDSLEAANGPLLEYDRQIISQLYNGGKDIKTTDAVLPACEDGEADNEDGGVDPLCIRYDSGSDPTEMLAQTLALVKDENASIAKTHSLATAIRKLRAELGETAVIKSKEEAAAALKKHAAKLSGTLSFYYGSGAQSLGYAARVNIRQLKMWQADVLPATFSEPAMRQKAINALRYVAGMESFETSTTAAITDFKSAVQDWLMATPYVSGLGGDKSTQVTALLAELNALPPALEKALLSATRTRTLADLKNSLKAPFHLVDDGSSVVDFETEAARLLARSVKDRLSNGAARPVAERVALAATLKTYKSSAVGGAILRDTIQAVELEARSAKTTVARQAANVVYGALTAP